MQYEIILLTPNVKSHRTAEETLALGYLASVLRKNGNKVIVIDGWLRALNSQEIINLIINNHNPDIICFSCYRSNMQEAALIADQLKKILGNIPTICGGYGPTFHDYDFLNAGFDVVVRGEAENIISDLIVKLINKKNLFNIPSISFIKDGVIIRTKRGKVVENLDDIPNASRDEINYSISRKNPIHICTSRGCNGNCSFCSVFAFTSGSPKNSPWRQRSIINIVDEIEYLCQKFGISHFKFIDDSFLESPRDEQWSYEFAKEIHKRNLKIKFRTQIRANRLTLPIALNLKSCGWFATSIGIENFSNNALKRMNKGATSEDNIRALKILQKSNIFVQAGLIMFDRYTTLDELKENCRILNNYKWIITKGIFTEMFAAEGTIFTTTLQKKGYLKDGVKNQNKQYDIQDVSSQRAYRILKDWHKSHALLYDWVIDSITAPKIITDFGYASVQKLSTNLLTADLEMMQQTIKHIESTNNLADKNFLKRKITSKKRFYERIKTKITEIYSKEGLAYDGVLNPFLD